MEYNLNKKLILLTILYLFSSCGENLKYKIKERDLKAGESMAFLEGGFLTTNKKSVKLESFTGKPLVLMFADSFCIECIKEVKEIRNSFKKSIIPKHINFLSLVIGEGTEEGGYWKEDNGVPWVVGEDEDLSLFEKYCPDFQTPCTVISNPDFGIVLQKTGKISIELIQSYLGEWE